MGKGADVARLFDAVLAIGHRHIDADREEEVGVGPQGLEGRAGAGVEGPAHHLCDQGQLGGAGLGLIGHDLFEGGHDRARHLGIEGGVGDALAKSWQGHETRGPRGEDGDRRGRQYRAGSDGA